MSEARTWGAALAALLLAGCGSGPPPGGDDACRRTPGFICAVAGTGKAGLGAEAEPALQSELFAPQDVAVSPERTLLVVDTNNYRIREVDGEGIVRTVVGSGVIGDAAPGPATQVQLDQVTDVTFDDQGRLIVAAWRNHRIMRVDADGVLRTLVGTGRRSFNQDGLVPLETDLDLPVAVAVDPQGALLFSDQGNLRVRRLSGEGAGQTVETVAGSGASGDSGDGGPAALATFSVPSGQAAAAALKIAVGGDGTLWIADSGNHRVRRVDGTGLISTAAGTGSPGAGPDGPATTVALQRPTDVAVGPDGSIYVADTDNSCIRRIDGQGALSTVAGRCGEEGDDGDGAAATGALLNRPFGIHVDSEGRLYIADTQNHRVRVVLP